MAQLQRLHNLMRGLPPPPESLSSMQATPMHIPCIYHAYTMHIPHAYSIPCIYHAHTESLSSMQASSAAAASSSSSSSSATDAASHHCSACGKGIRNDLRRQLAGSNEIGGWRSHNLTLAPTLALAPATTLTLSPSPSPDPTLTPTRLLTRTRRVAQPQLRATNHLPLTTYHLPLTTHFLLVTTHYEGGWRSHNSFMQGEYRYHCATCDA